MRRYKLVTPYSSEKVYETSSLTKGAKKCYDELKGSPYYYGCNKFIIMDIDDFKKYDFGINTKNASQRGGYNFNKPVDEPTNLDDKSNELKREVPNGDLKINDNQYEQHESVNKSDVTNRLTVMDIKLEKIISMLDKHEIDRKNREFHQQAMSQKKQKCNDDGCSVM
jgi:hypothetical protein